MSVLQPVLHVDFVSLRPDVTVESRRRLLEAAGEVTAIESVIQAAVIEGEAPSSDYEIALLFLLSGFEALEPFGTDARYVHFLQGMVAPLLASFSGADVHLDAPLPAAMPEFAGCLALAAEDETYDWEIRERLEAWNAGAEAATLGLSVGERQRFRGVALRLEEIADQPGRPEGETVLVSGRWRVLAP